MADFIGVLGATTAVAVGTTTAYTVPTSKAAKVKLMFRGRSGSGGLSTFGVTVNGVTVFGSATMAASQEFGSVTGRMLQGPHTTTWFAGATMDQTIAPGPSEYYLSAGDLVQVVIAGGDLTSLNFQVVGAEVDAS